MSAASYGNPQAMRQAIGDRLRRLARERPGAQLPDLQRQFAYDRLLSRVFYADPDRWVLKGATAMLARLHGLARHTLDIDLYDQQGGLTQAEQALRAHADLDLGDYFQFTLHAGQLIAQDRGALRLPVLAYLGATEFANFHVDLSVGHAMTGVPETTPALAPIALPGLVRVAYRVYPVVDHVADKVCALLELHHRQGGPPEPSTRYKDLADLAAFAHTVSPKAHNLTVALSSEAARRGVHLPATLAMPEGRGWRNGYLRVARNVPGLAERNIDSALATVRRFIDPVLQGTATGQWRPEDLAWQEDVRTTTP